MIDAAVRINCGESNPTECCTRFRSPPKRTRCPQARLAARSEVRRLPDDAYPRAWPRAPDQQGRARLGSPLLIVTAAPKLRQEHFVIDGEAVVISPDGVSDFGALRSGRHYERAQLYAFDMLAGDGEDQRQLPLSLRKTNLARLLKRRIPGGFIAEYEQGEIGRDLFRVACSMGLEGIVSKRRHSAYTPGKCRHWVKTKNPAHPAYSRVTFASTCSRAFTPSLWQRSRTMSFGRPPWRQRD
jgi:bifunctional non-homologous end joining protein LigD